MSKKPTLHEQALRLFGEIKRTDKQERAQGIVSEYNALVQAQKVNLKPVLDKMQAAFDQGEVIGGAPSLKVWCKMYKHEGVLTYARCRQIITKTTGHENRVVKPLDLKEGTLVSFGGKQFTVASATQKGTIKHATVPSGGYPEIVVIQLYLAPVEEPKIAAQTKQEQEEMLEHAKNEEKKSQQSRLDNEERRRTKVPRQSGRTRGAANKTARGIQRFKGTHTLLNPTTTHCGIYYTDKPEGQFYNTCDPVDDNPTCPACKWHLKRLAGKPDLHYKPGQHPAAEALAETLDKVDGAACGTK